MKIQLTGGGFTGSFVIRHTNGRVVNMPVPLFVGNPGNMVCVSDSSNYAAWEMGGLTLLFVLQG